MLDKVYLTRSEMARARRLDPRNKQLQQLVPDGILLMGSKAIPIFRGGPFVVARLSAAGGTVDPKMPLRRPEPAPETRTTE
jgi:hypothetical protein